MRRDLVTALYESVFWRLEMADYQTINSGAATQAAAIDQGLRAHMNW